MNEDLQTYLQAKFGHYSESDHGFCKWYIRARFGSKVKASYTDKSGDGGFDAIVEDDGSIYIIQSKYSQMDPPGRVPIQELQRFIEDVDRIRGSKEHAWEEHVKTLRADLKKLYNETRKKVRSKKYDCHYILVTNRHRADDEMPEYIEVEDIDNITPLWNLYSLDFTPTSKPIKLSITQYFSKKVGSTQSYVGLASLSELKTQLDNKDLYRLLVQNVRTDLHTKINKDIEATYVDDPDHFWMFNNGVYITCSKAQISGDLFTLSSPSVINGGQTVASVFNSVKTSDAQVLIRICEVDVQKENTLLRNVILRTNSQNPVKPYNLVAHDRTMLNIARYLDQFKIYFERRESEWKNIDRSAYHEYEVVDIRSLTQWMAALTRTSYIGTARQSVSKLFDREAFDMIFSEYETDDYTLPSYTQLAICVWVGKLVDSWIKSIPTAHKLKKKNAQVSKLIIISSCLDACRKVRFDVERATDMLRGHRFGRNDLPASIKKALAELRDSIEKSAITHYPEQQLDILTKSKEAEELLTHAYAGKIATNLQQAIKRDGTAVR